MSEETPTPEQIASAYEYAMESAPWVSSVIRRLAADNTRLAAELAKAREIMRYCHASFEQIEAWSHSCIAAQRPDAAAKVCNLARDCYHAIERWQAALAATEAK